MLEAMSCGCVVIGSNTPPVLEIIEDNYNGLLVDFFNPEQIVQKINDVLENPKKMQTIKDNARNTIVKNYDLKTKCLPEQVRLIKRICNLEISSNPH
jgi:glycosyltransferase involved in cell wall biosynthesis